MQFSLVQGQVAIDPGHGNFEPDRLIKFERNQRAGNEHQRGRGQSESQPRAQFQLFLVVRNIDAASEDHNEYIWLGVPFFDNRHDIPPGHQARDAGKADATGKFIYSINGRAVNYLPMKTKVWVTFQGDLLAHIKAGLQAAADRGFLSDTDPGHYAVVNMNLGWEMPGTYDAAMQVRGLEVDAVLK